MRRRLASACTAAGAGRSCCARDKLELGTSSRLMQITEAMVLWKVRMAILQDRGVDLFTPILSLMMFGRTIVNQGKAGQKGSFWFSLNSEGLPRPIPAAVRESFEEALGACQSELDWLDVGAMALPG